MFTAPVPVAVPKAAAWRAGAASGARHPQSLGSYRIQRMLGQGRMGRVYLAVDGQGCRVALKVHERRGPHDAGAPHWFDAERQFLAGLRDRRIVQMRSHGAFGPMDYLSLEYIEGGSLRDSVGRAAASAHALRVLREAASAVAASHAAGVVHRDVKPENFLVRHDGTLALADFGVAARAGDRTASAPAGTLVGSIGYAAPEQLQGETPAPAADVYSLGIVLFELLCGRRPFEGATPLELISQHLVAPVPRLPACLAAWQPIVDRLLHKRPQHRPSDAAALLHEIQAVAPQGAGID